MPPKLELVYFDGAGRAEAIRIMLHAGGMDFTDTRFAGKDWPKIKPTTPLGAVPVLKVDGKPHCQSIALMRYAAKLSGFYPNDHLAALVVDEVADSLNEIMSMAPRSKDPAEMEKLRKDLQATTMTKYATRLEGLIQDNGGCFVTGKTPTMGDLAVLSAVKSIQSGMWDHIDKNFYDQYPGIIATAKAVSENEKVKAYYASKE